MEGNVSSPRRSFGATLARLTTAGIAKVTAAATTLRQAVTAAVVKDATREGIAMNRAMRRAQASSKYRFRWSAKRSRMVWYGRGIGNKLARKANEGKLGCYAARV